MSIPILRAKNGMRYKKIEIQETIKSLQYQSILIGIGGGKGSMKKRGKIDLEIKALEKELSQITTVVGHRGWSDF